MIDFFGALRRGDFEAAAGLLDPDVSWQGLREEWAWHGREEVVDTFRWGLEQRREIDALEFTLRSALPRGADLARPPRRAMNRSQLGVEVSGVQ
jgi:ketosteroid isomerase-like protein